MRVSGQPLYLFIFFLQEDFAPTKSTKRIQANKNKKDRIFMRIKTPKRKKIACFTFCAFCAFYSFYAFCAFYPFYVHKKHLRGGKSLVCVLCFFVLFMFLMLFMRFVLFVRVKSSCKKK